jgi:deoxyribodipyrimidine photo-lyase
MSDLLPCSLVWLRRDLRLDDHAALAHALARSERVVLAFVLDPVLLRGPRMGPPIVQFFFDSLAELRERLRELGSDLALLEGDFSTELIRLAKQVGARGVFFNGDYDPAMAARDAAVIAALRDAGLETHAYVDHVYVRAEDVVQAGGKPYTVFTPYRKRWNARIAEQPRAPYPSREGLAAKLLPGNQIGLTHAVPKPEDYGHASSERYPRGGMAQARRLLDAFIAGDANDYLDQRNFPAVEGTSRLSPHLRAGTIGIRTCVSAALDARARRRSTSATNIDGWIGELTWRDFYQQLLVHFPRVAHEPFIDAAKDIAWRDDARAWEAWTNGATGYPIVDAAMLQLNATGWMHNRLRMIVASFLTKHLLIDYHDGERYFEQHLADADLGANNGGWQWSASTGTDAAPYFRVFNPTLQSEKFDPRGAFIRRMIPALAKVPDAYVHAPWTMPPIVAADCGVVVGQTYPAPIVDHAVARERALAVFARALKKNRAANG